MCAEKPAATQNYCRLEKSSLMFITREMIERVPKPDANPTK